MIYVYLNLMELGIIPKAMEDNMKTTFMGASTKQGYEIAAKSREIVRSLIDEKQRI